MDIEETVPEMELAFFLNGKKCIVPRPDPETTLLQFLRSPEIGLYGAKNGCNEGGCGACTVVVSYYDAVSKSVVHRSVASCLYPLCALSDKAVTTVEGLGSVHTALHPLQERIARLHGVQCGFCTPGFIMSAYGLLRNNPHPTEREIQEALDGNLCRCTGYRPVLDAVRTFGHTDKILEETDRPNSIASSSGTAGLCPSTGKRCSCGQADDPLMQPLKKYVPEEEAVFPAQLVTLGEAAAAAPTAPAPKKFVGPRSYWHTPYNVEQLCNLKKLHPNAVITSGNTEVGLDKTRCASRKERVTFLYTGNCDDLKRIDVTDEGVVIGAVASVNDVMVALLKLVKEREPSETAHCAALAEQLRRFGNAQIRNVASVGGSVATASVIGDVVPVLMAAGAVCRVAAADGVWRDVPIAEFVVGRHKVDLHPHEVLSAILLPWSVPGEVAGAYKASRRRVDDYAIVSGGFCVALEEKDGKMVVKTARVAYSGMGSAPAPCPEVQAVLVGNEWTEKTLDVALDAIDRDLPLTYSRRVEALYRRSLAASLLFKFFTKVEASIGHPAAAVDLDRSVDQEPQSARHFTLNAEGLQVHMPHMLKSAEEHTTGESTFVDDTAPFVKEFHAAFVRAKLNHAHIKKIDASAALEAPGVVAFFSAEDIPGKNVFGSIRQDEEILASHEVMFAGQPVGIVVAETKKQALEGALLVVVDYEPLPALLTIEDAVAAGSFQWDDRVLQRGDTDAALAAAPHVVEGTINVGGQYHFYLEPHASIAYPGERDEVVVRGSTQACHRTQGFVADMLGVDNSKVTVISRRLGGSFGGKDSRSMPISLAAALSAYKLRRPVRMSLERQEDAQMQGKRNPCKIEYCAGFDDKGILSALKTVMTFDGGNSLDLSGSVMELGVLHAENCYNIPNIHTTGRLVKTNRPSNTAFRGFGRPQSIQITETVMERIANVTGLSPTAVREVNMFHEGDKITAGLVLKNCNIRRMWGEIQKSSDYDKSVAECDAFNAKNRHIKRGVGIVPYRHGIGFIERFLNQGAALVHVYAQDGTVLITISGTEMGQGLYTKMCQVAASVLKVPMECVHIVETSTDKIPNQTQTAASTGTDFCGGAVQDACEELLRRVEPYRKKHPDLGFMDLANKAYFDLVSLSATGYFSMPHVSWNFTKEEICETNPQRDAFPYVCWGCAASVVEVDTLTGDYQVLRTDILQDVGKSLNPAIDVGQIEGAFTQGMGYYTMEELVSGPDGLLITDGPGTLKPPVADNVPRDFRVSLLTEAPNPFAVYSSKAIGEPPFALAYSVHVGIRRAIAAARKDEGLEGHFALDSPATCQRIRLLCRDKFTRRYETEADADPERLIGIGASGVVPLVAKKDKGKTEAEDKGAGEA